MVKRVKYGHVKVEDAGEVIRLHVGNVYRDLSVSYARILAGHRKSEENSQSQKQGLCCNVWRK